MIEGPGAVIDRTAVLVPTACESALSVSTVHSGMYHPDGSPPASVMAVREDYYDSVGRRLRNGLTFSVRWRIHMVVNVNFGHV